MRRRAFLKATAAAAVGMGVQVVPRRVLGAPGVPGPNSRIRLAAIGAGGQAAGDLNEMAAEHIVALCDVDDVRAADMFRRFPEAKKYKDFRVMLGEMGDEIDAVLVGTPDHTHAAACRAAMGLDKPVFCEKPLAHHVAELRDLRRIAKDRGLITQLGNQGHSSEHIRLFVEWVRDGAIGEVTEVHAGCDAFPDVYCQIDKLEQVRAERPAVPGTLDWDLWQGPVVERPYHPVYVPWGWRGWTSYGTGAIGDWVCHVLDPIFWALDLDMPTTIRAETEGYDPKEHRDLYPRGSRITYQFAAKGGRGPLKLVWHDGSFRIPRPKQLEDGRDSVGTGAVVYGTEGAIMHGSHGAGGCRLIPETAMQAYKRPEQSLPRVAAGHHRDWLEAIREGRPASSPFEYGGRLSEVGLLGMIAIRHAGQELEYDEASARFTNSEDANRWLDIPPRSGWKPA